MACLQRGRMAKISQDLLQLEREHLRVHRAALRRGIELSLEQRVAIIERDRAAREARAQRPQRTEAEWRAYHTARKRAYIARKAAEDPEYIAQQRLKSRMKYRMKRAALDTKRGRPRISDDDRRARKRANKKAYRARMRSERPEKYRALMREQKRRFDKRHPERARAKRRIRDARREARTATATPPWLDIKTLIPVFAECITKNMLTPGAYHVDHVAPLNGETCSGLHVPWNLRVIPSEENLRKSNDLNHDLLITLEERQQVVYTY